MEVREVRAWLLVRTELASDADPDVRKGGGQGGVRVVELREERHLLVDPLVMSRRFLPAGERHVIEERAACPDIRRVELTRTRSVEVRLRLVRLAVRWIRGRSELIVDARLDLAAVERLEASDGHPAQPVPGRPRWPPMTFGIVRRVELMEVREPTLRAAGPAFRAERALDRDREGDPATTATTRFRPLASSETGVTWTTSIAVSGASSGGGPGNTSVATR